MTTYRRVGLAFGALSTFFLLVIAGVGYANLGAGEPFDRVWQLIFFAACLFAFLTAVNTGRRYFGQPEFEARPEQS